MISEMIASWSSCARAKNGEIWAFVIVIYLLIFWPMKFFAII